MFPPSFEPGTFCMWGERGNNYAMERVHNGGSEPQAGMVYVKSIRTLHTPSPPPKNQIVACRHFLNRVVPSRALTFACVAWSGTTSMHLLLSIYRLSFLSTLPISTSLTYMLQCPTHFTTSTLSHRHFEVEMKVDPGPLLIGHLPVMNISHMLRNSSWNIVKSLNNFEG